MFFLYTLFDQMTDWVPKALSKRVPASIHNSYLRDKRSTISQFFSLQFVSLLVGRGNLQVQYHLIPSLLLVKGLSKPLIICAGMWNSHTVNSKLFPGGHPPRHWLHPILLFFSGQKGLLFYIIVCHWPYIYILNSACFEVG